jgi:hypothetical protein
METDNQKMAKVMEAMKPLEKLQALLKPTTKFAADLVGVRRLTVKRPSRVVCLTFGGRECWTCKEDEKFVFSFVIEANGSTVVVAAGLNTYIFEADAVEFGDAEPVKVEEGCDPEPVEPMLEDKLQDAVRKTLAGHGLGCGQVDDSGVVSGFDDECERVRRFSVHLVEKF